MGSNEDTFVRFHEALATFSAAKLKSSCPSTLEADTLEDVDESDKRYLFVDTPPLERFLGIPASIRRRSFFESLQEGNVVRGKVEHKWIQGLIMKIESVEYGKRRWIRDLNLKAHYNTQDNKAKEICAEIEIGDKVRAVVCSVNANEQKIDISLLKEQLPSDLRTVELGNIDDCLSTDSDDLEDDESYLHYLRRAPVFSNPGCVQNLTSLLKINTKGTCSFLNAKNSSQIPPEEVAERLRENQSFKWSLETTAIGIKAFKLGKFEEALKYIDQALQLCPTNVEALVARGALKANKTKLKDAITDFRQALSIKPTHRNGHNYLTETLISLAKQYEKDRQWKDASRCYRDVLEISPTHDESNNRLQQVQFLLAQQMLVGEKSSCSSNSNIIVAPKTSSSASSISKIKSLLEDETRQKKSKKKKKLKKGKRKKRDKKKRRSKSSSTSSSVSTTDSEATESATEGHDDDDDEWVEKEVVTADVSISKESYLPKTIWRKQASYEKGFPMKAVSSKRSSPKEDSNKHVRTHSKERDFVSLDMDSKVRTHSKERDFISLDMDSKVRTHSKERDFVSLDKDSKVRTHSKERDFISIDMDSKNQTSTRPLPFRESEKTFRNETKRKSSVHDSPVTTYIDRNKQYERSKEAGKRLSIDVPNNRPTTESRYRKEYTNVTSHSSEKASEVPPIAIKKLQHFSNVEMNLVARLLGNTETTTSKIKPSYEDKKQLPTDSQENRFQVKRNRHKSIDSNEHEAKVHKYGK